MGHSRASRDFCIVLSCSAVLRYATGTLCKLDASRTRRAHGCCSAVCCPESTWRDALQNHLPRSSIAGRWSSWHLNHLQYYAGRSDTACGCRSSRAYVCLRISCCGSPWRRVAGVMRLQERLPEWRARPSEPRARLSKRRPDAGRLPARNVMAEERRDERAQLAADMYPRVSRVRAVPGGPAQLWACG